VSAAAALGPRQAAVLEHLAAHPGLTAGELERFFGLRHSLLQTLHRLEQQGRVVAVTVHEPAQGRRVSRWHVAPPGTVPPARQATDADALRRRRERDTAAQRGRRARRRPRIPPVITPALSSAACKGADADLFFGPDAEFVTARREREAKAKAICADCPVRLECLAYALDTGQAYGIWGGLNEDELRVILRQRRAS
jgi:hypothetical protein